MRAAAIQMASSPNVAANLMEAERLIERAAQAEAQLVVLPENFASMGHSEADKIALRETDGEGPIQDFLAQQARRHGLWLVGGTVPLVSPLPNKVIAACPVYNDQGERVARYDKIHLFDVNLPQGTDGSGDHYVESETIDAGDQPVALDSPWGRIGLAVCYDLRFPELFRTLAEGGLDILAIPAAFTAQTGRAHWEVLLRARAIENLCYVVAAAQGGYHVSGRETYGDSMLIDPWGTVLTRLARGAGVVSAELDLERLQQMRRSFPVLEHRRLACKIS